MCKTRLLQDGADPKVTEVSAKRARHSPKSPPTTLASRVDNSPTSARPTMAERAAAAEIITVIRESPIKNEFIGERARNLKEEVVALGLALYFGETFASEAQAKRDFNVGSSTEVKRDWALGKLPLLFKHHPRAKAAAANVFSSGAAPVQLLITSSAESEPATSLQLVEVPAAPAPSTLEVAMQIKDQMSIYATMLQQELATCRDALEDARVLAKIWGPPAGASERDIKVLREWHAEWKSLGQPNEWEKVTAQLFKCNTPFNALKKIVAEHGLDAPLPKREWNPESEPWSEPEPEPEPELEPELVEPKHMAPRVGQTTTLSKVSSSRAACCHVGKLVVRVKAAEPPPSRPIEADYHY